MPDEPDMSVLPEWAQDRLEWAEQTLADIKVAPGIGPIEAEEAATARAVIRLCRELAKEIERGQDLQQLWEAWADDTLDEMRGVEAKVDRALEALRFYANADNWHRPPDKVDRGVLLHRSRRAFKDCGATARKALKEIEGKAD